MTSEIRITKMFGDYCVSVKDSNGVWVSAEPGADTFATRDEAQEYVDRWADLNEDITQVDDGPSV